MNAVQRGPIRVLACSADPCASFEWIVARPPSLSHELCSLLTDAPSGGRIS